MAHRIPRSAALLLLPLFLPLACGSPPPRQSSTRKAPAADMPAPLPDPASPAGKIASAMSAAPQPIAAAASVAEVGADGKLVTLRQGTNGWLCLPDNPDTPGPDPLCVDGTWQQWFGAYMAHKPPALKTVGISYMLQGSHDASNTDPYARKPAPGQDWVVTGPHIMIAVPNSAMLEGYPSDPSTGGPYVMWKGTPYAHLMVPLASTAR